MKYGLTETTVEKICAVFARFPEIEKAILYGSRAKGNFKTGSDIDLTLHGEALTTDLCSTIASELDDLLLPYTIDLSVFDELNHAKLLEHIERVGVLFYQRANHVAAMKEGWEVKELGAVSTINYGYTESATSEPVGPRFLRITDIQDDHVDWQSVPYCKIESADFPKYRLATGDVVFARTGATTGKSFLVNDPPEAVFASYLIRLRLLDKKLLPEFVSLFFQTAGYWKSIKDGSAGSAQGGFNATKLAALSIPIPPLLEQQRIVGILDEAFEGIATAKANAEKNLQNARALCASHLQSVFTQRGPGWDVRKIAEVAKHSLGKMLDKAKNKGKLQPYLRNINVRWFAFDLSDLLQMPFLPEESAKYTATKGDVLICEGGYPGRAAIWTKDYPIYFQKALHRVRFQEPEHNKWFLYYLYAQDKSGKLKQHFSGTGIQHFTGEVLARFELPLPPLPELRRAVAKFEELSAETQRLESIYQQKLDALEALKKSLLHQAFSGHL
jgi:type I restriction enzyme S subunit